MKLHNFLQRMGEKIPVCDYGVIVPMGRNGEQDALSVFLLFFHPILNPGALDDDRDAEVLSPRGLPVETSQLDFRKAFLLLLGFRDLFFGIYPRSAVISVTSNSNVFSTYSRRGRQRCPYTSAPVTT